MNQSMISQGQLLLQYLLALETAGPKIEERAPIRVAAGRPERELKVCRRTQPE